MIQLNLLDLAQKQFPNLNFDLDDDIIKIEKILKAEAKLNPQVKINDIENLITFLRNYRGRFIPILKNKNISTIVTGKEATINFARFDPENIPAETLHDFEEAFSSNILEYLRQCIRNNKWNSLRSIFMNYTFLVGDATRDEIYQILKLKNQAIISAIYNNQFVDYVKNNSYCADIQYYSMLSTIDQHFFDDDILAINNIICEKQKTTVHNKVFLGKILYAASYFNAYTESLKETLENNQQIALQWVYPNETISNSSSTSSTTMTAIVISIIVVVIIIAVASGATGAVTPIILCIGLIARLINAINSRR
ncbi:hypothetical protein DHW03_10100 [Pedobacter yonginense]|uniref:Uncharacterized protein n=1 Tax=Pedobacter yonginense TaxID=651869 RepID=A0A317EMX2_9SPHI|nr:hypothetical protein [Pedobacter yonginense]PWS27912.1 hypothetical protein DHW03_10100 [Pedobacter yonginense]